MWIYRLTDKWPMQRWSRLSRCPPLQHASSKPHTTARCYTSPQLSHRTQLQVWSTRWLGSTTPPSVQSTWKASHPSTLGSTKTQLSHRQWVAFSRPARAQLVWVLRNSWWYPYWGWLPHSRQMGVLLSCCSLPAQNCTVDHQRTEDWWHTKLDQ